MALANLSFKNDGAIIQEKFKKNEDSSELELIHDTVSGLIKDYKILRAELKVIVAINKYEPLEKFNTAAQDGSFATQLSNIKAGKAPRYIGLIFAWLWKYHKPVAKKLYKQLGLKPRLYVCNAEEQEELDSRVSYFGFTVHQIKQKGRIAGILSALILALFSAVYYSLHIEDEFSPTNTKPEITMAYDEASGRSIPVLIRDNSVKEKNYYKDRQFNRASYLDLVAGYKEEIEDAQLDENITPTELAWIYTLLAQAQKGFDIPAALISIKTAIDLDGNSATSRIVYGQLLSHTGKTTEALKQLEIAETLINSSDYAEMALLSVSKALMNSSRGYDFVENELTQAIEYANQANNQELKTEIILTQAAFIVTSGKLDRANTFLDNVVGACDQIDFKRLMGLCYQLKAGVANLSDNTKETSDLLYKALKAYQNSGNKLQVNIIQNLIAVNDRYEHGISKSEDILRKTMEEAKELNFVYGQILGLQNLSQITALDRQKPQESFAMLEEAIHLARLYPDQSFLLALLTGAARSAFVLKKHETAGTLYQEAFEIAQNLNNKDKIIETSLSLWQLNQNDQTKAKFYSSKVTEIVDEFVSSVEHAGSLIPLAKKLHLEGHPGAIYFLEEILAEAEAKDEFFGIYHTVTYLNIVHPDVEKRILYGKRKIDLLNRVSGVGEISGGLADAHYFLGVAYYQNDNYELAYSEFLRSEDMHKELGLEIDIELHQYLLSSAIHLSNRADIEKYYVITSSFNLDDVSGFSLDNVLLELSTGAFVLGKYSEAKNYLEKYFEYHVERNLTPPQVYYELAVKIGIALEDPEYIIRNAETLRLIRNPNDPDCLQCNADEKFIYEEMKKLTPLQS